jgi:cytochrome bd ubiquinol oxidase subunit I
VFGVMSAKNTVVNIMILSTFLSFLIYRRGNKGARLPMAQQSVASKITLVVITVIALFVLFWAQTGSLQAAGKGWIRWFEAACIVAALGLTFLNRGTIGQWLLFAMAAAVVVFFGAYGYFVEAIVRIGFSIVQVSSVLMVLILGTTIDVVIFRGAPVVGEIQWGKIPERAQYILFLLATSFTWLMGLMGYARSGLRTHWHVFNVVRDYSSDAFTPPLGFACWVISVIVVLFMLLVSFIFWLAHLGTQGHEQEEAMLRATTLPALEPEPATGD